MLCLSSLAQQKFFVMGSVGDNYVCPHCDVKGAGGYAHDAIGYPICVEGRGDCLAKIEWAWTRAMVKYESLMMVFDVFCASDAVGTRIYFASPSRWPQVILVVGTKIAEFM